ncbi:type II/IV secretion system protein [Candidatus Peregrinibacteria bacterium]|nr:type II/IV secretion system protein [Candidatus Peregrinibacteria bacterium]
MPEQLVKINREFQEKSTLKRAKEISMPYIDIAKTPLNPDFLRLISFEDAKKSRVIPFLKISKKVHVAVDDSENPETKAVIEKLKADGFEVSVSLASSTGIDEAINFFDTTEKYKKIQIVESVEEKSIKTYEKEISALSDLPAKLEQVPAEEAINLLNIGAMKTNASDVHYEPFENQTDVRFRIDGVLHKVFSIKSDVYEKLAEQIKYQGGMRLNVKTVPQDGRYTFVFNNRKIAVRTSTIPTPYGESFVCRYLPSDQKSLTFEELGFQGEALKKLMDASKISQGMVLVTGPTGSGKSTTLYSIINLMNNGKNKIITLEDPVEYYIIGATQSQIDERHGYTFASGLRSILRHDPDIVMIGEIRDLETAETSSQAALTGHVLLSTLHTNSAIETIPRLINIGLPPFMIAPALNTIIAQRLVRKVCTKCSTFEAITESEKTEFTNTMQIIKDSGVNVSFLVPEKMPKVHGCEACSSTGYNGRIVIAEAITINNEIKDLILNKASLEALVSAARKEGMITMYEDGLMKVAQGLTTLEEVHRVTNL